MLLTTVPLITHRPASLRGDDDDDDDGVSSLSEPSLDSLLREGAKATAWIQFLRWGTSSAPTGGTAGLPRPAQTPACLFVLGLP